MALPLQILHVEDSLDDFALISRYLRKHSLECDTHRVQTREELRQALDNGHFDVILSDYKLPGFSGLEALEMAHQLKPEIPFIFVSGAMGEDIAIESFNKGANDYVLKDRLTRLPSAIRHVVARAQERKAHEKLQERLVEAARLEAISILCNGIAHDFNNILAIIMGQSSLLALAHPDSPRSLEHTSIISEAAQRGKKIVLELMAFARKSDGTTDIVDINERVQKFVVAQQGKFSPAIHFAFLPGTALPSILVNPSHLDIILHKLLDNAIEAMPTGGKITLSTEFISAGQESSPENVDYLCLKMADTGRGMEAAVRQHAFEPFYTTKERGRGTGLGLSVVYGLMEGYKGLAYLESEPGGGTVVSLLFPVPPVSAAPSAKGTLADSGRLSLVGTSEAVLVVEDEVHVCSFIETVLQSRGYQVFAAHNREEALKLFHAHARAIQLVYSDIGLPGVDGITLCSELKALKPALKIIISSGYSYKEYKDRLDKLGVDLFLPKPCVGPDILNGVRTTLKTLSS